MAQTNPMKKNTACKIILPIFDADGDLVTGATGLDSEYSVDGGAFADCANEATEIGSTGIYYLNLAQAETNGDVVCIQVKTSTSGAKTTPLVFYTAAQTFDDLDTLVDAEVVKTAAIKAITDVLALSPKKNVAIAKFPFYMRLSSDHLSPATGKTVNCAISKDSGAFGACSTATATEVSNGVYYVPLTQTEMNATSIVLKFSEADCDTAIIPMLTST